METKKTDFKKPPQFKDLKFESIVAFNAWLKDKKHKTIVLFDQGQDLTKMYIHESGEILHCNYHASIYNGKFLNKHMMRVGDPIAIWDEEKQIYELMGRLIIEKIYKKLT